MKDKGFIVLYRQLLDWEWYNDANTMRLFIHCLLSANYENKIYQGIEIKRGQFMTSQAKLADSLKLSIKQIRGSLDKLKRTGEMAVKSTNSYSIITINNYNAYQQKGRQKGSQRADKRATTNNINKLTNISYINSLSLIREEEREILKNYLLRQKRKPDNIDAYIKHLINNGDYKEILEKEQRRLQRLEEKRKQTIETTPVVLTEQDEEEILKIQQRIKEKMQRRL